MNFHQNFREHFSENSYFPGMNRDNFEDTKRASANLITFVSSLKHILYGVCGGMVGMFNH